MIGRVSTTPLIRSHAWPAVYSIGMHGNVAERAAQHTRTHHLWSLLNKFRMKERKNKNTHIKLSREWTRHCIETRERGKEIERKTWCAMRAAFYYCVYYCQWSCVYLSILITLFVIAIYTMKIFVIASPSLSAKAVSRHGYWHGLNYQFISMCDE